MAIVNSTWQKMATSATMEALARAGPALARFPPARRAAVNVAEGLMMKRLRNLRANGGYLPRVYEDRILLGLAFIRTVERGIAEQRVSPAALRCATRILIQGALLEEGYRDAADRFLEVYGTHPPSIVTISPGKACNLRCVGCYADAGPASYTTVPDTALPGGTGQLDWDVVDRMITEVKTLWGGRFVVFSGGEPFIYRSGGKGILDLAEKHNDCYFLTYTNGTLINDEVAERLGRMGNLTPAISLEGFRKRTDARRGEGVFDKVVAAQNRLREAGVPFGISITATRENCEEILSEEFVDFCFHRQGALYGWIFQYMPIGRSYTLNLMPTPEQRAWMWQRSWEIVRKHQIFLADFWNHGTVSDGCLAAGRYNGGGYMYIDWNGSVNPCVFVPYSPVNINRIYAKGQTLNDAWASPFFAAIRTWQRTYAEGEGNWIMPCPNRDHHADLYRMLTEHEPDPADRPAAEALGDVEYHRGLADYDEALEALMKPIWEDHYRRPADPEMEGFTPMPRVFDPASQVAGERLSDDHKP
jgi:MoaA/NifB/PqqE/SkfB family radical SAM enzyme